MNSNNSDKNSSTNTISENQISVNSNDTSVTKDTSVDANLEVDSNASAENDTDDKTEDRSVKSKSISTENNLEMKSLKFTARMKAKREQYKKNTEGMSNLEKVKYFLHYNIGKIILSIILVFCAIALPLTIYKNTRPVAISFAVVNQDSLQAIRTDSIDGFCKYFNYDNGKYQIKENSSVLLSIEGSQAAMEDENNSEYSTFQVLCHNGHIDIIITDMKGLEYCVYADFIQPLNSAMTEGTYNQFITKYPDTKLITLKNASGDSIQCAIDISNTEFAKGFNLSYDEVYLCFPGSTDPDRTKAREIMEYIYGIRIEN